MPDFTITPFAPTQKIPIVGGPAFEYIKLLRSFLTRDMLRQASEIVDDDWEKYALDTEVYMNLLQSFLTPIQRSAVSERLEAVYLERGWV